MTSFGSHPYRRHVFWANTAAGDMLDLQKETMGLGGKTSEAVAAASSTAKAKSKGSTHGRSWQRKWRVPEWSAIDPCGEHCRVPFQGAHSRHVLFFR